MKNSASSIQYNVTAEQLDSVLPFENQEVLLVDVDFKRASGYGQYLMTAKLEINGKELLLKKHTTDSQNFDNFNDEEAGEDTITYFNVLEMVIDDNQDELNEFLYWSE